MDEGVCKSPCGPEKDPPDGDEGARHVSGTRKPAFSGALAWRSWESVPVTVHLQRLPLPLERGSHSLSCSANGTHRGSFTDKDTEVQRGTLC